MNDYLKKADEAIRLYREGFTKTYIANKFGVKKPTVTYMIRVSEFPARVREFCERGTISPTTVGKELRKGASSGRDLEGALDALIARHGKDVHQRSRTTELIRLLEPRRGKRSPKRNLRTQQEVGKFLDPSRWNDHSARGVISIVRQWFEAELSDDEARRQLDEWDSK